jgi:hypothetical protein
MPEWWSIEVFHGEFPARQWRDAYSEPGAGKQADLTVTAPPGLPHLAGRTP